MKRIIFILFIALSYKSIGQVVSGKVGIFRDSIFVNGRWYNNFNGGGGGISGLGQDGYIPVWKGTDSLSYSVLRYDSLAPYYHVLSFGDTSSIGVFDVTGALDVTGGVNVTGGVRILGASKTSLGTLVLDSSILVINGLFPQINFSRVGDNGNNRLSIFLDGSSFILEGFYSGRGIRVFNDGNIDIGKFLDHVGSNVNGISLIGDGNRVNITDTLTFVNVDSIYNSGLSFIFNPSSKRIVDSQLINLPDYFGDGGFFYVYKDDSVGALNKGHAVWLSIDSMNAKFPIGNQFNCLDIRDSVNAISKTMSNEIASYSIQKYNAATVDTFFLPNPSVDGGLIMNGFQATIAYELCAAGASFVVVYNPSVWTFAGFNCSNCTEPSPGVVKVTGSTSGVSGVLNIKVFQGKKLMFY